MCVLHRYVWCHRSRRICQSRFGLVTVRHVSPGRPPVNGPVQCPGTTIKFQGKPAANKVVRDVEGCMTDVMDQRTGPGCGSSSLRGRLRCITASWCGCIVFVCFVGGVEAAVVSSRLGAEVDRCCMTDTSPQLSLWAIVCHYPFCSVGCLDRSTMRLIIILGMHTL